MKVLFVAPLSIGVVHGGVRMQSLKTAEKLRELGTDIEFYNPWTETDPTRYDIIHIFLAGNETLTIANRLRNMGCKIALSPVFFTRRSSSVIKQSLNVESIAGKLVRGLFSDYSIKASVCKSADIVLPNTRAEAELIRNGFGIEADKITVIPNGVDCTFADASADLFESEYDVRNFTLFVGDCSSRRKNLLSLLEQHTIEDHPVVLIGQFDESDYSRACKKIINSRDNVSYLGPMDHDNPMLASAYAAADVFTLPSQFETPGIAALEAALAGCKIAITRVGGTTEIFEIEAEYIDPNVPPGIMTAIRNAHSRPASDTLKKRILSRFTWESVAKQTLEAYRNL